MWLISQTQAGLPDYSDLQILLITISIIAGLVFVLVVAPVALGGSIAWIAKRRPPRNWFVRACMVTTVVAIGTAAVVVVYSNLVSPDSGLAYWLPVSLMLLAGALVAVVILRRWVKAETHGTQP